MNKELFADPIDQPVEYLQQAFSLSKFLANKWGQQSSDPEQLWKWGWASLQPAPLYFRVNRLQVEPAEWQVLCANAGVKLEETDSPEIYRLESRERLSEIPGFAEGSFWVQDITASKAARLLNPYPGSRVLDLCAGPGTKSAQMAELMLDRGELVACEVVPQRIAQIEENIERLHLSCIKPLLIDRHDPEISTSPFDAILVDAPCSNTGVLGKRPEARWRVSSREISELNQLQLQLLNTAANHLDEEGRIVYSTCSIEPEENEQLIRRWLEQHPEYHCHSQELTYPTPSQDGGYCALLERTDEHS